MNKIFKVVWSRVKHCYVVTSEIARSNGRSKSSTTTRAAAVACAVALTVFGGVSTASAVSLSAVDSSGTPQLKISNDNDNLVVDRNVVTSPNVINVNGNPADHVENTVIGSGNTLLGDGITGGQSSTTSPVRNNTVLGNNNTVGSHYGITIGENSTVNDGYSIGIGEKVTANASNAIAIGQGTTVNSISTIGMGMGTYVDDYSSRSVAIGDGIKVGKSSLSSIALGDRAQVGNKSDVGIAMGQLTKVGNDSAGAIAVGNQAVVEDNAGSSVAIAPGATVKTGATGSVAMGLRSNVGANSLASVAIGWSTNVADNASYGTAMGFDTKVSGKWGTAIGYQANTSGMAGNAMGYKATVGASNGVAVGTTATTNASSGIAVGTGAKVNTGANRSIAIGNNVSVTTADSVVLGSYSTGSETATKETTGVVTASDGSTITYGNYVGAPVDGDGKVLPGFYVSVGREGGERQIKNVAAGKVSADSTDAINGSQLYATNKVVANLATNTITLGGDSNTTTDAQKLNKDGGVQFNVKGDGTYITTKAAGTDVTVDLSDDAKNKLNKTYTVVAGTSNVTVSSKEDGNNTEYTISVADTGTGNEPNTYFHVNDGTNTGTGNATTNYGKVSDAAGATHADSIAAGVNAQAHSAGSIAVGANTVATNALSNDANRGSVVIGNNATVAGGLINGEQYGNSSVAIGSNALAGRVIENGVVSETSAKYATNTGGLTATNADKNGNVMYLAGLSGDVQKTNDATAVGKDSRAVGDQAVAVGAQVVAGHASVAIGGNDLETIASDAANVAAYKNITGMDLAANIQANGVYYTTSAMKGSVAIGQKATSRTLMGTALGTAAAVHEGGTLGTAIGTGARVGATDGSGSAQGGLAAGAGAVVEGDYSTALGNQSSVTGTESAAVGYKNTVAGNSSVALGSNINVTTDNSVVLGANSDGSATATKETEGKITTTNGNEVVFGTYVGAPVDGGHYVSVGTKDAERQIKHVAAGKVSADSTDAINGSQLYATNKVVAELVDNSMSSFNVKSTATDGNVATGSATDAQAIKNGKTVEMQAGKNLTIKQTNATDGNAQVEYSLADNIVMGKDGKDGVDGAIGITGKDGNAVVIDGKDGSITATDKDGNTGVVINGKDGSIGIKGKDGANGISITGKDGAVGLDGTDGVSRIVYTDKDGKTNEVATMNDGLIFTGNNEALNKHKLNTTVKVIGEGVDKTTSTKFQSAAGNINVKADGTDTLTIQLNKDLQNINSISNTTNGPKITLGDNSINITNGDLNMGGNKITNVKPGTDGTDAVNKDQLDAVKGEELHITDTTYTVGDTSKRADAANDEVTLTYTDGNGKEVANKYAIIKGVANSDLSNITNEGNKVIQNEAKKAINIVDGKNTTVEKTEVAGVDTYKVNVADQLTLGAKDGKDGKDGVDGSIGINGKDGSAVVINGKDGSIGLNGKDGENGLTIKGGKGPAGVNGKDGETITRIEYERTNPDGSKTTEQVATLNDGLKFTGNNTDTVNKHQLNSLVKVQGEGVDKTASTNFQSAAGNINVKADGTDTLTIQLNKDLKNINSISNKEGGPTITIGDKSVNITNGDLNMGGNQITNQGSGASSTDANGNPVYDNNTNGANIGDVKNIVNGKVTTVTSSDGSISVKDTNTDPNKGHAYDITINNQRVVENAQTPVVYTTIEGDKVYKMADGSFNTQPDGSGTTVQAGDVIASMNNGGNSTTNPVILNNVGSAINNQAGNTYLEKLDNAAGKTPNAAVNVTDLKNTADALTEKGLRFDANDGGEQTNKLGSKVTVKGTGTKANTEYSSDNIKTIISQDANGDTTITVGLDKNLSNIESITINGKDGKDGKDGLTIKGGQGPAGVDGKNGETITRIEYDRTNPDGSKTTEQVATLNDGMKYAGDNVNSKVINKKLNERLDIIGGANKDSLTKNNIGVNANDNGQLEVQLSKDIDLTDKGSIKIGDTTINNGGLSITGGPSITKDGINAGGKTITNVAPGVNGSDAVNVDQLNNAIANGKTILEDGKNTTVRGNGSKDNPYRVDVADQLTLGGKDGKDGKNGVDGSIGINGKDGSAVVINGKDGSIGLNGKDGANGLTIKGGQGPAGVNGKDGETITRIEYERTNPDGSKTTEQVATLNDGLKFTGNNTDTVNKHQLNTLVKVQGEGVSPTQSANFQSAAGNINVVANGSDTLEVRLNKDLTNISSISNTTNGPKISFGDNSVNITNGDLNMGGNKITNVAPGKDKTDVATVGQMTQVTSKDESVLVSESTNADGAKVYDLSVQSVDGRVARELSAEIGRVGAQGAALAALKPIQYDPLEPTQIMAGYGNYRGNSALALGVAHYKNESTMIHGGVSWAAGDGNHMMANAGITWKVGSRDSEAAIADRYRKGPISSAYALQNEMAAMKAENTGLKGEVAGLKAQNDQIIAENAEMKAENQEMKAQIAMLMQRLGL